MANLKIALVFSIIIVLLNIIIINAVKINHPRVLLPIFDNLAVKFTLEIKEKGCFKWTSSRQDLILLTPFENDDMDCTYRANVTVLTRERRRNTAIVLAEDLATGQTLRCDVILDVIHKLGVHTTTRQLYLEEAPAVFELRAEDSQGNEFTTLEGVEFKWIISSLHGDNNSWLPPLRFLTFTDSDYHEVPTALIDFEAQGLKGYMVLLEGIRTGSAKLSVSLPYREYKDVNLLNVYINVLANIIIEPSEVYIMPGDTINFRIYQLHMGKLQEITLNEQYFLVLDDKSIADLIGNSVTGIKYGSTTVQLHDRNVPTDNASKEQNSAMKMAMPSAELVVAEPMKLGLSLLPYNNWITVEGIKHEIALDLYTRDEQKITLGSRYSMSARLDETLFKVLKRNSNGSRLYGEALHVGLTPVYGTFNDLAAQAELQIYGDLHLEPKKVLLPFDPQNIVMTQKIQFHASGGDGGYSWHSLNKRLLQVNQSGVASTVLSNSDAHIGFEFSETITNYAQNAAVKVTLTRNPNIERIAHIYFLPPVKLEIVKYNFETALKDCVRLHVAIYAYANNSLEPLTNCDSMFLNFEFTNQIFQVDNNGIPNETVQPVAGACKVISLRSRALGLTNLRVLYKYHDRFLQDEVVLSVFEELQLVHPYADNEVILPIGASLNVIYANGPERIFTLEAELTASTFYDRSIIGVSETLTLAPVHVLNVLCRKVGETALDFNIHNAMLSDNFEAYISSVQIMVRCVKPRFLNLYAMEELRDSCPIKMKNTLLQLKERDNKFVIQIDVQDVKNRRLMNISSLHLDWEFSGASDELYPNDAVQYQRQVEEELLHGIRVPGKNVLLTTLTQAVKVFRIKGMVTHYDNKVLDHYGIEAEYPHFSIKHPKSGKDSTPIIENEISFITVNSTRVFSSDQWSIFMARKTRVRIPILQGSGYYGIDVTEADIINVEYDDKTSELIITPLGIGHTTLELTDKCLVTSPAYLSISVVAIRRIEISMRDRVERTKSIEAVVSLYDSNDNPLHIDPHNLNLYDLSEMISHGEILSLKLGEQVNLDVGQIRYIVTGNKLGEAKIAFTAGSDEHNLVTSNVVNVQVFPPMRLLPRNSTLIIGSSLSIMHQGGPQPDVNVVYEVHDNSIVSMESSIVTARTLGVSRITGRCMMSVNGKQISISEDTIQISVVPLTHIQVKTPLVRIRVGAVMPAAVWGTPDLSPMILGTLKNMHVHWSTNRPDVVEIYNIFSSAGIEYKDTDMITARVKAQNPGKTKITATVALPSGESLSSSVEIIVFDILELMSPKPIKMDWILVAPRSTIQLKANLDDVVYGSDKDSSGIVQINPDGFVRTYDALGRDLIIAKTFEQSLPIGIEVKNVQYILASMESSSVKLKQTEKNLPRGITVQLKVLLYDNQGNEFSHNIEDINNGIKYDISHKDVVDVHIGNNLSLSINLPCETSSMIAISLRDTSGVKYAEDYIKLSVAESEQIYPTKAIFVPGDIVCFDSPLSLSSFWSSSDEEILSIDKYTGIARVLNIRSKLGEKLMVINGDRSSGTYIKYDVEIREADVIQSVKAFDIFNGITYRGYVVIRNHLNADKTHNLIARNASKCTPILLMEKTPPKYLICKLVSKHSLGQLLLNHYKVTPVFDVEVGRYACQIELISSFNEVLAIVKTNDVHVELQFQLSNGLLDSVSLKLVPGIKVSPDAVYVGDVKKQELIITGLDKVLQKVELKSSDIHQIEVELHAKSHGSLQYRINVKGDLPNDKEFFIIINSPQTMQTIRIPVLGANSLIMECSHDYFGWGPFNLRKFLSNLGLIVTMGVIIFSTVWVYLNWGVTQSNEINPHAFVKQTNFNSLRHSLDRSQGVNRSSPLSTPVNLNISPYYGTESNPSSPVYKMDNSQDSQVYGDTTIMSPQKRINRRYL